MKKKFLKPVLDAGPLGPGGRAALHGHAGAHLQVLDAGPDPPELLVAPLPVLLRRLLGAGVGSEYI